MAAATLRTDTLLTSLGEDGQDLLRETPDPLDAVGASGLPHLPEEANEGGPVFTPLESAKTSEARSKKGKSVSSSDVKYRRD